MALFEVFIPRSSKSANDATIEVKAESWLDALKAGMKKIGEQGDPGKNMICDFQDDGSVHVTDPDSGRVFRIVDKGGEKTAKASSAGIGRSKEKTDNIEDALEEVFDSSVEMWEKCKTREEVADFMLELALKKIKAESAGFLFCTIDCDHLSFVAAKGPKAKDVLKFKVPLGTGIVGFCVQAGVSLAISDVGKDARWYDKISKSVGYPTKSMLCSVVEHEGQVVGAIEIINRSVSSSFTTEELHILNYIAHESGKALARISDMEFSKECKKK